MWQMDPQGLTHHVWAGRGTCPGTFLQLARMDSTARLCSSLLLVACLHASPFVTLSSPPHLKADPQGSWTKHTEQGMAFLFLLRLQKGGRDGTQ